MISAILLAAGTSQRFGKQNKLLAKYKNKSLITYSLKNLINSKVGEIIVVLGSDQEKMIDEISSFSKIKIVYNKNFKKGMSSTILTGINNLNKDSTGFLICLSDMPKIKSSTYNKIINSFKKKNDIPMVPFFKSTSGNPVCFPIDYKLKLKGLKGDRGAKNILKNNKFNKIYINSNSILIDFDKKFDFKK